MTDHTPVIEEGKVKLSAYPVGSVCLEVACSCGKPGCHFWYQVDRYDWTHSPAVKPDNSGFMCGKIAAIKEIRSITDLSLLDAKNAVDEIFKRTSTTSQLVFYGTRDGWPAELHLTALPGYDSSKCVAVQLTYKDE